MSKEQRRKHLPSLFANAKRSPGVHVSLLPRDVMEVAPHLSPAEAEALLEKNVEWLSTVMLAIGVRAIRNVTSSPEDVEGASDGEGGT